MIENFVSHFGYMAVFLGTFLEGETFILIGGFFAHRGYLDFIATVLVATLGAFSGDLFYFFLGRRHGRDLALKSRRARDFIPWIEGFIDRYHVLWIFAVRYFYGVRWLAALLAGSSKLTVLRFVSLALPACILWALVVGTLGYAVGSATARLLGDLQRYEIYFLLAALLSVIMYAMLAQYWRKAHSSR